MHAEPDKDNLGIFEGRMAIALFSISCKGGGGGSILYGQLTLPQQ